MRPPGDSKPPWSVALITGASSGIGEALARDLAQRGVFVILTARRLPLLKMLAIDIQKRGGHAVAVAMDVADTKKTVQQMRALDKKYGGIDLVIANAGVGVKSSPSYSWEAVAPAVQTNYAGALATLTALLPQMVSRGRGHLVAMSSLAGFGPLPDAAAYSSPKAGLSRFMECLALDLQRTGVSVSTVHVGFVRTPMVARSTFPLPFLMEVEAAAAYMVRGLLCKKREINFPRPMVIFVRLMAALPFVLKKWLARRFSPAR